MITKKFWVLCALFITFAVNIHAELKEYTWNGNLVSSVTSTSETDNADNKIVYLYNVATKKFLNVGSDWGTSIVINDVGMPIHILSSKYNGSSYYNMYSDEVLTKNGNDYNGSYIGYTNSTSGSDLNKCVADNKITATYNGSKYYGACCDFTFTRIGNSNTYYLICYKPNTTLGKSGSTRYYTPNTTQKFYLTATNEDIDYTTFASEKSVWMLITRQDLLNRLEAQHTSANYIDQADATFFINDQAIHRSTTTANFWYSYNENGKYQTTPIYTDGIGNVSDNQLQAYGKYWHAYMTGNKNGYAVQFAFVSQPGWYRVSCDGFFHAESNSNIKSYLYANGNTVLLNKISSNNYKAFNNGTNNKEINEGIKLANDEYPNSVMIYVDQKDYSSYYGGYQICLGIKVEESSNDNDRTVFDNFTMTYCCQNAIVLDENAGEKNANKENIKDYPQPLILKRTFTTGVYNSFCLPVSLTKKQMLEAFGSDIRMATLNGVLASENERIIHFNYVNIESLNDDDYLLEKDKFYLIKPTNEGMVEQTDATTQQHFYVINNVMLNEEVNIDNFFEDKTVEKYSTAENGHFDGDFIRFRGTYINLDGDVNSKSSTEKIVWGPSYILKDDATRYGFYHCMSPENVKGFRCWIYETDIPAESAGSKISFSFSNGNVVSSIDQLDETNIANTSNYNKLYNLSGQQVSNDYKGMVIKNGKKYLKR